MNIVAPDAIDPEIVTAAINAVAVASTAYQEAAAAAEIAREQLDATRASAAAAAAHFLELERFRYVATLAARHGVTVSEIAAAGGITCEQVATLVNQGEL